VKVQTYKLKVIFVTPLLGSQPTRDIASSYLAQKHGFELPEDEIETLPDALEHGTTVFHRFPVGSEWTGWSEPGMDGEQVVPGLFDYQMKGSLKNAGKVLNGQLAGRGGKPVRALRQKVADRIFVSPRRLPLHLPEGSEIEIVERPLRAQTPRGERVALARSECVPEETWFECGLTLYPGDITEEILRDLLDYGYCCGLGQWRGGGWGRFRYELVREE